MYILRNKLTVAWSNFLFLWCLRKDWNSALFLLFFLVFMVYLTINITNYIRVGRTVFGCKTNYHFQLSRSWKEWTFVRSMNKRWKVLVCHCSLISKYVCSIIITCPAVKEVNWFIIIIKWAFLVCLLRAWQVCFEVLGSLKK